MQHSMPCCAFDTMETITNKIRCFIWKRAFVLGRSSPILPTLNMTVLGDEIVAEKMYTIFIL